jgi:hypothetical protein
VRTAAAPPNRLPCPRPRPPSQFRTVGKKFAPNCPTDSITQDKENLFYKVSRKTFHDNVASASFVSSPVRHSLHVTLCMSPPVRHSLHVTLWTSLSARHSPHFTVCTSILHVTLCTSPSARHSLHTHTHTLHDDHPFIVLTETKFSSPMIYIGCIGYGRAGCNPRVTFDGKVRHSGPPRDK